MKSIEIICYFILFGITGIFIEVLWTAIRNTNNKKYLLLRGYSFLWMFPIYGLVFFIILLGQIYFSNLNILFRGLIYTALILFLEYTSGYLLKKFLRIAPWDYSYKTIKLMRKRIKSNFRGLICLNRAWMWYILSIVAEQIYLFLQRNISF